MHIAYLPRANNQLLASLLVWGEPALPERSTAVWLTRPRGIEWRPVLEALRQQLPQTTLWRRQMVLGPGREFALIVPPDLNVAAPAGWSALAIERVRVDASVDVIGSSRRVLDSFSRPCAGYGADL